MIEDEVREQIESLADVLSQAKHAIALTGAGISVESGIPAFRGEGGLWEKYPADEYATYSGFLTNPLKQWAFFKELYTTLSDAAPNPAHYALAELERLGMLKSIITQNIDNLHQRAGSKRVLEFHGTTQKLECMSCGAILPFSEEAIAAPVPTCRCGGVLKPMIVLFGEQIADDSLRNAQNESLLCDIMLVIGTSAQVVPASMLPVIAKSRGAMILEMNVERTLLSNDVADLSLLGSASLRLPRVVELVSDGIIPSGA